MSHDERVEASMADPTRQFKNPMDVVRDADLDLEEKRKILESWKKDAELLSTATDENMAGGERPRVQDVSLALSELEKISGRQH